MLDFEPAPAGKKAAALPLMTQQLALKAAQKFRELPAAGDATALCQARLLPCSSSSPPLCSRVRRGDHCCSLQSLSEAATSVVEVLHACSRGVNA